MKKRGGTKEGMRERKRVERGREGERGRGGRREGEKGEERDESEPLLLTVVISGLLSRYGRHSSDLVFSGLRSTP